MRKKFKKGDWVFADYELMMIEHEVKTIPGRYAVRNWCVSTASDNCYPLTLKNQAATDHISSIRDKVGKMAGINMPDVHQELIRMWVRMVESDDQKKMYDESNEFFRTISLIDKGKREAIFNGINLFK